MPGKPRLLLLDANAVFAAYEVGAWEVLCSAYQVVVPSVVVRQEAQFYIDPATRLRQEIDLPAERDAGKLDEFEGTAAQLAAVLTRFTQSFRAGLDAGEIEALAYLLHEDTTDLVFVTADATAVIAVAMLGLSEHAMCLADVLDRCGYRKRLPYRHGPEFFKRYLEEGRQRFVTGDGLVR